MSAIERLRSANSVAELFDALVPGQTPGMVRLRAATVKLSENLLARGALILGPPGSGKSTLARAIALGRYVHLLRQVRSKDFLKSMRLDGPGRLSTGTMDWYRELSLTGLVTELADAQLFGIGKGVATGVTARDGIFRLAMHGGSPADNSTPTNAASATGGVVFLDEIGDFPASLQPKLLTVLTGAPISPVGLEGQSNAAYSFGGLTIAATWQDVRNLRPDLLARLSDHILHVPGLAERLDDLPLLVAAIVSEIRQEHTRRVDAIKIQPNQDLDKTRICIEAPPVEIDTDGLRALSEVDWEAHGDIRGLTQILRAVMMGSTVHKAIEAHHCTVSTRPLLRESVATGDLLLARMIREASPGMSLARALGDTEQGLREELRTIATSEPERFTELAQKLGITVQQAKKEIRDLTRNRKRPS